MDRIDDQGLVTEGLQAAGQGRILLIACGALAREVLALRDMNGWSHMDLQCLPAILHNHPEKIPDAVERAVTEAGDAYDRVFVLYADCGTGGLLQARCAALGVEMLEGPHCYSFFEGNAAFAARGRDDGLLPHRFPRPPVRRLRDETPRPRPPPPELRDMYFGNYETLGLPGPDRRPRADRKGPRPAPTSSASPSSGASRATGISKTALTRL